MSVPPPRRKRCRISAASPTVGARRFQGSAWPAARYGEGSAKGGRLLLISFGVSFRLPFPSPSGPGRAAGRRREARLQLGEGKPSQKPVCRATSASRRPLNAGSHFGTQPIAEGDMPTPKNPSPTASQNTKQKEEQELGGRQRYRRSREATLLPRALPAVSNHAPQGSEPAQIPNYFLLQCRACILDGAFPVLAGEKRQPLCLPASPLLPAERSPGGSLGKQTPRLANEERFF